MYNHQWFNHYELQNKKHLTNVRCFYFVDYKGFKWNTIENMVLSWDEVFKVADLALLLEKY